MWTTVLTLGSAGASIVAAVIAVLQARHAKTAAEAARRQADAADAQLAILRRQDVSARSARDEADGPVFRINRADTAELSDGQVAVAEIEFASGRPLSTVFARAKGGQFDDVFREIGYEKWADAEWETVTPGDILTVYAHRTPGAPIPPLLTIELFCMEDGSKRRWTRQVSRTVGPVRPV